MLGDLEENFKSLEQGSKGMLSQVTGLEVLVSAASDLQLQAKRLAAQNSAKSWFGF
jgi:hypothetical protein